MATFKQAPAMLAAAVALVLTAGAQAAQDEIVLKNGSRILGTVTDSIDGKVTVETEFAGTLTIDAAAIEGMRTQGSLVVKMADGRVLDNQPLTIQDEQLLVTGGGEQLSYAVTDILRINPEPWELGHGYKWTGVVSAAMSMQRGNTDTDELDYRLESIWRSLEDRFTLRGDGEVDKANDVKNADNWSLLGKYDRFLDGPWYWGVNASAESDEFADLDLRYYIGPYIGRQIYDTPALTLSAEAGIAYVNEDFILAEDQEYPGANWNINMTSNYLGGDSRLYLDHVGIWNLKEASDLILKTTFGLAFPLMANIEAAAEVIIDHDSGAVEGVDKTDQTYNFRIGYTW